MSYIWIGLKLEKFFDLLQSFSINFFLEKTGSGKSGKNPDMKIPGIFEQILLYEHTKVLQYQLRLKFLRNFFEIFSNFDDFELAISPAKKLPYAKIRLEFS